MTKLPIDWYTACGDVRLILWSRPLFNTEWEMFQGKGFVVVLCWSGPLLIGSTVCVRHILVFWPPGALDPPEITVRSLKY